MKRFFIYVLLTIGLIYFITDVVLKASFFQIFNVKELMMSDLAFNDLYYRDYKNPDDSTFMNQEKQVVLINISDIPHKETNRDKYRQLIEFLWTCEPAAIGVDLDFTKDWPNVFEELAQNPKIIFAESNDENTWKFPHTANVQFPNFNNKPQRTIRYYNNSPNSFAAKLVKAAYPDVSTSVGNDEKFLICYHTIAEGIKADKGNLNHKYYHFFNSSQIFDDLKSPSKLKVKKERLYKPKLKGKILIVGILGHRDHFDAKFDIEDRFRVPVDTNNLINRDPVMHGATIHANAISTILNKENQFYEVKGWVKFIIPVVFSILLVYGLMFLKLSKLSIRSILVVLSFITIYGSLELMKIGIYLQLGGTVFALIVVEELYELIEEIEHKLPKWKSKMINLVKFKS